MAKNYNFELTRPRVLIPVNRAFSLPVPTFYAHASPPTCWVEPKLFPVSDSFNPLQFCHSYSGIPCQILPEFISSFMDILSYWARDVHQKQIWWLLDLDCESKTSLRIDNDTPASRDCTQSHGYKPMVEAFIDLAESCDLNLREEAQHEVHHTRGSKIK